MAVLSLLSSLMLLLSLAEIHVVDSFAPTLAIQPSSLHTGTAFHQSISIGSGSSRQAARGVYHANSHSPLSRTGRLKLSNKNDFGPDSNNNNNNSYAILAADLVGVAIACQLLGLVDVLSDRSFWAQGGWLQPIPAIPTSLSVLVQRISENALVVTACSFFVGGYQSNSVASIERLQWIGIRTTLLYGLLRVLLGVGIAYIIGTPLDEIPTAATLNEESMYMLVVGECLREVYCVSLTSLSARYVMYVLYYR
jgi:hypothetical protein